ncbi:flavin-containing monooxygenase [Nocardioides terrisoli]|uniref:flavin-containing monooxygenase n=1 Tax=Nocardioides terrisoli TaxID=3388267 RepID=UPI00287BC03F|nr:NAD(P)/FAD-dependent oxidoreductase [Nocardioides marmorisolisilvae]
MPRSETATDHVDVLIVGAGLSGVGAAVHLHEGLPELSYAVLERRSEMGGTWDLFRYPGVRSDSDMHTLGYRFRPWHDDNVLADGASIKRYVEDTAAEYGVTEHIRFGHRVVSADWDSDAGVWTVGYEVDGVPGTLTSRFVWACSGYYSYDEGHTPDFAGVEDFRGQLVHPQFWPEDLDYAGKKVVVIGSGATAVTLVPSMADEVERITMLQRSPTYILSIPRKDPLGPAVRAVLPEKTAAGLARWRNVLLQAGLFQASQRRPDMIRKLIRSATERQLPEGYDVDTHFKPSYDPWDQRMCMVPNGDLFKAIRAGKAEIATDRIDRFTEKGILLASGEELEADIVVTATGLKLQLFGGVDVSVDGERVEPHERIVYKGCMLDGVPNLWFVIGYTNASWTLKADLVSEYVVRVLQKMGRHGESVVRPVRGDDIETVPLMPLQSGYVQRAVGELPQAGSRAPWQMPNNYLVDIVRLRRGRLRDGALTFS